MNPMGGSNPHATMNRGANQLYLLLIGPDHALMYHLEP